MIEIIALVLLSIINLALLYVLYVINSNNDKQVLILTKALSAKNFSDMQHIEDTHTKQSTENGPELAQEEFVSLSDLSDEEASKLIKKQLEFKDKK